MPSAIRALSMLLLLGIPLMAFSQQLPINDLPNPFTTHAPWGETPQVRGWGALNSVSIDNDGTSVWVADRCGANPNIPAGVSPFLYDSCAGSPLAPIMKFDSEGHLLKNFGAGMFSFPHKIYVDPQGSIWVVDGRSLNERESKLFPLEARKKGNRVVKFSPDGQVLLVIGRAGLAGNPPEALTEPNSIVVNEKGDIFISEGHGGQSPDASPDTVARISKFDKNGKFIKSFGKLGSGPVEFKTPHDLVLDKNGLLYVADRGNMRIQILDQDGHFLKQWEQFSRPSGLYIRDGMIYVADSESNGVAPHVGWKRGIRIGTLKDGSVQFFIPDPIEMKGTSAAEGLAVDAFGNIYGAEVGPRQLVKYVR